MSSSSSAEYLYRPPWSTSTKVNLRSCSSRRARLVAGGSSSDSGGTYWRAREPGMPGNRISVEVVKYSNSDACCIITNHNLSYAENVTGPVVKTNILELNAGWRDLWTIKDLHTNTPRVHYYSISCQIGVPLPIPIEIGLFDFNKIFINGDKISIKLSPGSTPYTPSDVISIASRRRIYRLAPLTVSVSDPATMSNSSFTGWDIANLRAQVNASNPWVEMLERSGDSALAPGGPVIPNPNKVDVQDTGLDGNVLYPFAEAYLSGGDGLPADPNVEHTGPGRSLVKVNYGEAPNGTLKEISTVYEWAGDTNVAGAWKKY